MREVQFAAGGRQIAPTFPLIDARFLGTPIHRERPIHRKTREVQLCRRRAANCTDFSTHRNAHSRPIDGNAIALDSRERPMDSRERAVL